MRHESDNAGKSASGLAWVALPFLVYLTLLSRLWFDAPIADDYSAILEGTMRLMDARTFSESLQVLLSQHNEHRIVITRAVAWTVAKIGGDIDFRVLVLLGNLGLAAIIALLWSQFRDSAPPRSWRARVSCFASSRTTRAR